MINYSLISFKTTVLSIATCIAILLHSSNWASFLHHWISNISIHRALPNRKDIVIHLWLEKSFYCICIFQNNSASHLNTCETVFGPNQLPTALPSETPIWATWYRQKENDRQYKDSIYYFYNTTISNAWSGCLCFHHASKQSSVVGKDTDIASDHREDIV